MNPWLEKETQEISSEIRRNRKMMTKSTEMGMLKNFVLVGLPCLLFFIFMHVYEIERWNLFSVQFDNDVSNSKLFPSLNKCPQEGCDHLNYEGIEFCPLCGSKQPS